MSMSLLPGLLGLTTGRNFSFYPPLHGVEHNEWRYRRATWSEFIVVNTQSGKEACVQHSFLGEVSLNGPTAIVGLRRELEWRDGLAVPYRRPVVELPVAVNGIAPATARRGCPAPVVSIRLEPHATVHTGRKAVVFVMLGVAACAVVADVARPGEMRHRLDSLLVSGDWQRLRPGDDYGDVIRKLGPPSTQRTYVEAGGRVFRSLDYPHRHFTAVLEGQNEAGARYVGTLDPRGRLLGTEPASGAGMLRAVPRF